MLWHAQVNAGASEVAKVFLAPDMDAALPEQSALRLLLKVRVSEGFNNLRTAQPFICLIESLIFYYSQNSLLQFLEKSKLVLEKYRLLTATPGQDPFLSPSEARAFASNNDIQRLQGGTATRTISADGMTSNGLDETSPHKKVIEKYYSNTDIADAIKGHRRALSGGSGNGTPPLPDTNSLPPPPQLSQAMSTTSASELVWLTEMEKGYDALVDAIFPFITDVAVISMNRTIIRSFSTFGDGSS